MKELGKMTKGKDVSLETNVKIIHTVIISITVHGFEARTVRKADRKKAALTLRSSEVIQIMLLSVGRCHLHILLFLLFLSLSLAQL